MPTACTVELKRFRSWSDRRHGQELAKLSKLKEENNAIMSRIQNEYGSDNPQENSGLSEKPYSKSIRLPYSKQIQYNVLNNNNVVVEDGQRKIFLVRCRKNGRIRIGAWQNIPADDRF